MQHHFSIEQRLQGRLERRLCSAPAELRAVATATRVRFNSPDFELTPQQEAAAEKQLKSLAEARAAFRGRPDNAESDVGEDFAGSSPSFKPVDRVAAFGEAVVKFDRASRILRQCGLKLTIALAEGSDNRAVLAYRRAPNTRPPAQ
jgi:hypothetical protein